MTTVEKLKSVFEVWSFSTLLDREVCYESKDNNTISIENQKSIYLNKVINFGYRVLLVQAACLVCLAHGSNDVANSIAPLLEELSIVGKETSWAYWLGGLGIAVGLLTLGYKVMETVGKKVIKLDFYKGFAC